jgi:hypothetical protein
MTESSVLDLQARQFEKQSLSAMELSELEHARQGKQRIARLLESDAALHDELKQFHRIEATAAQFALHCAEAFLKQAESDSTTLDTKKRQLEWAQDQFATRSVDRDDTDSVFNVRIARQTVSVRGHRPSHLTYVAGWVAVIALTGVVFAGWVLLLRGTEPDDSVAARQASNSPARMQSLPDFADQVKQLLSIEHEEAVDDLMSNEKLERGDGMVELRASDEAIWEKVPETRVAYPAKYQLRSGLAELVTADGTELALQGPAGVTFHSPREIALENGKFRVRPTTGGEQFLISTPTARMTGTDELLAYFQVQPDEGTLVQIEQGKLQATAWNENSEEVLTLSNGGMNRAIFSPAWRSDSAQLATAIAVNEDGEFTGLLATDQRALRIASPELFAQILAASRNLIREDPTEFPQSWSSLIENLEQSTASTNLKLNGRSLPATNAGEMLEQFRQVQQQMIAGLHANDGNFGFSGVLSVDGKQQHFGTPQEFREAQTQMFGNFFGRMMTEPLSDSQTGFRLQLRNGLQRQGDFEQNHLQPETDNNLGRDAVEPDTNLNRASEDSGSFFSGSININGQVMQFDSPEQFNRAMRGLQSRRR